MKRKKLLKRLADFLDRSARKQRRRQAELEELLEKLGEKEADMEHKLSREKNADRRKQLSKQLQVVKAQRAKGIETLRDLEAEETQESTSGS